MPMGQETAPETHPHAGHRDRLRKRLLSTPPEAFPDYELLELLLFYVRPRQDTKPLAKSLLSHYGSVSRIFHAPAEQLSQFPGMGEPSAIFFRAIKEIAIRLAKADVWQHEVLDSWEKLLAYCRIKNAYEPVEVFRVLHLNRKHQLIGDIMQQSGTIDHATVYPREVVKEALSLGASALILLHNHPSGDPTPSAADIDVTLRIASTAKPLGITVLDHIIITPSSHTSLKALGLF